MWTRLTLYFGAMLLLPSLLSGQEPFWSTVPSQPVPPRANATAVGSLWFPVKPEPPTAVFSAANTVSKVVPASNESLLSIDATVFDGVAIKPDVDVFNRTVPANTPAAKPQDSSKSKDANLATPPTFAPPKLAAPKPRTLAIATTIPRDEALMVPMEVIPLQRQEKAQESTKPVGKYDTASMIGPPAESTSLFSSLQISEKFEHGAAVVGASRTRDMDAPGQALGIADAYTWISPVFYHKPLYFEQPNLERYGQGTYCRLQPAASAIHFFGTIPLLPYKMLTQHPNERYYTLGNNRPGDCVPVQRRVILGQSYLGEARQYWSSSHGY